MKNSDQKLNIDLIHFIYTFLPVNCVLYKLRFLNRVQRSEILTNSKMKSVFPAFDIFGILGSYQKIGHRSLTEKERRE